jgi:hypothetical protein
MKKVRLVCQVSPEIVELLKECAKRSDEPVGEIVEKAVYQYMGGRPNFRQIIERVMEDNANLLKRLRKS